MNTTVFKRRDYNKRNITKEISSIDRQKELKEKVVGFSFQLAVSVLYFLVMDNETERVGMILISE